MTSRRETSNITEILHGKRIVNLAKPLQYEITTDDHGTYILECKDLDIHAYGASITEAIDAANEEFLAIWDSIGLSAKDELHETALSLREKLLEYVNGETR